MGNGTSIGRVRGLGSAHSGAHHWLLQRFTAVGNLLLSMWLVVSLILLPDLGYETVSQWMAKPLPATAMALLIVSTFWHARLGLQVVIEDYVHGALRLVLLIATKLFGAVMGVSGIAAIATILFRA